MKKLFIFLFLASLCFVPESAKAATFVVTSDFDTTDAAPGNGVCADADGRCTLRAAVQEANAFAGTDTINFSPAMSHFPITLALGEISITENLTINGLGANLSTVSGNRASRIFYIAGVDATIRGLKLINGNGVGTFFSGRGGAIYANGGRVALDGVSIEKNTASETGGGVYAADGTTFCITNSVFIHNTGNLNCGGLYGGSGNLSVSNTTFSGNETSGAGGGVCNYGAGVFRNVTIAENVANNGGGVYVGVGSFNVGNTLIVNNIAAIAPDVQRDASGAVVSVGYNLLTNQNGVPAGTFSQPGDVIISPFQIGALTNNGGPTWTHAIYANSAAHNTGNNALAVNSCTGEPLTTDQRGPGFPRINGGRVDIGAYELPNPTAASVTLGGRVLTAGKIGRGISRAVVSLVSPSGEVRYATTNNLGYYRFEDVGTGEQYVITVSHKRYDFAAQTVFVNEEINNLNFIEN